MGATSTQAMTRQNGPHALEPVGQLTVVRDLWASMSGNSGSSAPNPTNIWKSKSRREEERATSLVVCYHDPRIWIMVQQGESVCHGQRCIIVERPSEEDIRQLGMAKHILSDIWLYQHLLISTA